MIFYYTEKEKVKMNYCYVIARIISDIDYKFMMEKKKYAKAVMQIELTNKSIIKAVAYNLTADYVLRNLNQGMEIAIEGELHNNEIEIKSIEIFIQYIL